MITLSGKIRFRCFASVVFPEQVPPLGIREKLAEISDHSQRDNTDPTPTKITRVFFGSARPASDMSSDVVLEVEFGLGI